MDTDGWQKWGNMLEIIIEDDIFVTSNIYIVDTKIHMEYDGYCFPSAIWTDFTFPILEEWKNTLFKAKYSENFSFNLYFHDGPFWLEVFKNDSMNLKIDFINDRMIKKSELTIYCGYYELMDEIYKALKTFAKILYKNKMHKGNFLSVYNQTMLSINELKEILK